MPKIVNPRTYAVTRSPKRLHDDYHKAFVAFVEATSKAEAIEVAIEAHPHEMGADDEYKNPVATPIKVGEVIAI